MGAGLTCAFGKPVDVWTHRHHCAGCQASVEQGVKEFERQVLAGEFNWQGYTEREWVRAGHPKETWQDAPRRKAS